MLSAHLNLNLQYIQRQQNRADFDEIFLEKADGIIKAYFKDFKNFKANWLVKVTWENMTVVGIEKKVSLIDLIWLFYSVLEHLSY